MAQSKRERSRGYPQYALEDCVQSLKKVWTSIGGGPYSRDALAEGMGMTPGSGAANSRVAAMVHYGILERQKGAYHLSSISDRILHPTREGESEEAVAEAVTNPDLFRDLFDRFNGQPLPKLLANVLARDFGIVAKQAGDVARIFTDSVESAGLLAAGNVLRRPFDSDRSGQPNAEDRIRVPDLPRIDAATDNPNRRLELQSDQRPVVSDQKPIISGYRIPLSKGKEAVLDLPRPLTEADVRRIISWLELMGDVLVEQSEEDVSSEQYSGSIIPSSAAERASEEGPEAE